MFTSNSSRSFDLKAVLRSLLLCVGVVVGLSACGPGYLDQDKKVPATEVNREIFQVLKTYHEAIEAKDMEAIKPLISPRYHENAGTTDKESDDYGYDGVLKRLTMLRDNVKKVQLRLKLLDIQEQRNEATVEVEFVGRVLMTEGGIDSYKTWDDFNRMTLAKEGGHWLFTSGL